MPTSGFLISSINKDIPWLKFALLIFQRSVLTCFTKKKPYLTLSLTAKVIYDLDFLNKDCSKSSEAKNFWEF
jgi:hypothetical protein